MTQWLKVKSNKNFHFHGLRHTAAPHAIMGSKDSDLLLRGRIPTL